MPWAIYVPENLGDKPDSSKIVLFVFFFFCRLPSSGEFYFMLYTILFAILFWCAYLVIVLNALLYVCDNSNNNNFDRQLNRQKHLYAAATSHAWLADEITG